jgi:aerobic carbon-monoxide dehydrogenase medium subunit
MKPPAFAYLDPGSVAEAVEALSQHGDDGKVLAGGQSLIPLLNMRLAQPSVLIDLNRISELDYAERRDHDGAPGVSLGAMTRQRTLEDMRDIGQDIPMLAEAVSWVGHPQIRNRGTIGGSIAHADPAAELPLVFRTLGGIATLRSARGERHVPAEDFFVYTFTSALEADELLSDVWLPIAAPRTGQAFVEVARRHGDFALVAAAASLTVDHDGTCTDARIGVGGAAPVPVRAAAAEETLIGQKASLELFKEAGKTASKEMEPTGDVHADAEYRRDVAGTLVYRALTLALDRAGGLDV